MNLRRRMEDGLGRDIRDHIEIETEENIARGMPPGEARAAALRKFGNVLRTIEDTRAVWRWSWAERLLQDSRHAARTLRRNPAFAAIAICTLALGIGMNTAVFSVIGAAMIEPLPYPNPQRLVWLSEYNKAVKAELVIAPDYLDWRAQSKSFDQMFSYGYGDQILAYGTYAGKVTIASVSGGFWPITGAKPAAGRLFTDADRDVIVISHSLFATRFASDPSAIGATVTLNGRPAVLAGVLPRNFKFLFPAPQRADIDPQEIQAYVPSNITPQTQVRGRANAIVNVIARLKPGTPIERARGELEAIQARIARQNPFINYKLVQLRVMPMLEKLIGDARPALLILMAAAAFVQLAACANIAALLLARAVGLRREAAIRSAIGAGQLRLIAQFLTEATVLALASGVLGLLFARLAIAALRTIGTHAVPRLASAVIDERVLGFTLLVSLASALLFGLGPAIALARANLSDELKESRKTPPGVLRLRPRALLVAGEIAVALVLATGAGLMLKSLWRMSARPPGFSPEKILVMKISLSGPAYRSPAQQTAYLREALTRLRNAPGTVAAGSLFSPVRGVVELPGAPSRPPDQMPQAIYYSTSAGYFRAMGIRLLAGRWMDDDEKPEVALVNEAFVQQVLSGANPVGKRVHIPAPQQPLDAEIVGVVSGVKYSRLDAAPGPEVYYPYTQSSVNRYADLVVLTSRDPLALAPSLRKLVLDADRSQPVFDIRTLDQALSASIAPRRFNLFLLGVFAASALLLALIGIYGLMSYAVKQRTHEIGVRMALGARRAEITGMVVRQGMAVAAAGILTGAAAALALTRLMAALLFEVKPNDAWTFTLVAGALGAAALVACWLPACRAARVDPAAALRYE